MTSPRAIVLCQYHYDPLDRLIGHAPPDVPERQRFYCKSRLATEIQGAMRYSIVQHGDQLLAQQRNEADAPDTTLLATDQQRSVLQTLKANHPPQPIAYSPYGHRPVENGLLSLLGFNGERPDPVTGCYLLGNGYRAFNPVLMRFNSPDSWSPFGKGELNAYGYCAGEPINRRDPTGHAFIFKALMMFRESSARTSPNATTNLGMFGALENIPHLNERIIRNLNGRDMISLSSTSKSMKNLTGSISKTELANLSTARPNIYEAARGDVAGILPSEVIPIIRKKNVVMKQLKSQHATKKANKKLEQRRERQIARDAYYFGRPDRVATDIRHKREMYLESIGNYETRFKEFVDSDFSD